MSNTNNEILIDHLEEAFDAMGGDRYKLKNLHGKPSREVVDGLIELIQELRGVK